MSKSLKCYGTCGNKFIKDELIPHSGKNYCQVCYSTIAQEKDTYRQLIDNICKYFNVKAPSGMVMTIIKQNKDKYEYSYAAMIYVLWYMIEVERKEFDDETHALESIKFNYEKANEFYLQQERIQNSVKEYAGEKVKVVNVKMNTLHRNDSKKFTFDLDELLESGE